MWLVVLTLICIVIGYYLYFFFTKFEKKIMIKQKYKVEIEETTKYFVVDTKDNTYIVDNCFWSWCFNKEQLWNSIDIWGYYNVSLYGLCCAKLNLYHIIYKV